VLLFRATKELEGEKGKKLNFQNFLKLKISFIWRKYHNKELGST
jgi:hypothetical protein